jgi:hypothetical protein
VLPTAALVGALVAQDRPDGFEDELDVQAKERLGNDAVIDARHESFIEDPKSALRRLCDFLSLEYGEDYLEDCASIVFGSPRKSRHDVGWSTAALDAVRKGIDRFDFLKGYSYEE